MTVNSSEIPVAPSVRVEEGDEQVVRVVGREADGVVRVEGEPATPFVRVDEVEEGLVHIVREGALDVRLVRLDDDDDGPVRVVREEAQPTRLVRVLEGEKGDPGEQGDPGPKGDPGTPGAGSIELVFNFAVPTTIWVLEHGLNTRALNVETQDGGGDSIEGDVIFVDANTIEVHWYFPTAGTARVFR